MTLPQTPKDYLWLHLRELPYFRALLRAVEARVYEAIEQPSPTLDLGCGDGHFASIAFERQLEVGLDPWTEPIRDARRRGVYRALVQADGGSMPFPRAHFASAVSNSVLEHIPDIDATLADLARVLRPGAQFVFCVPNDHFTQNLSVARFFDRVGMKAIARAYRNFFNRISRHRHVDPPRVWEARLQKAGFRVERWWHYFSPAALRALEWGHYWGLPALVNKLLFGRWILAPTRWNLGWLERRLRRYYEEAPAREDGAYTFYVARRVEG